MRKKQFKKRYILYLMELLVILTLVLSGIFRKEESVFEASASNLQERICDENGMILWRSDSLTLKPGVYRISVGANIANDSHLALAWEVPFTRVFREIKANTLLIYPGQTGVSYEITITAKVEAACLQAHFYGNPSGIDLTNVTIIKTNQMYLVLAFCVLLIATAVNLLVRLRFLIREERVSGEQQMVIWVLMSTVLIVTFPYLTDYINIADETVSYLIRIEGLKQAVLEANMFSVLIENCWLLIPACLRILGFSAQEAYRLFVFSIVIATALVCYHCFKCCMKNRKVALLGTVIYMLSPCCIYNYYNRGSLGECLGMIFYPLIICGVYLFFKKDTSRKAYISCIYYLLVGFAGLLQDNLFSFGFLIPISAMFSFLVCLYIMGRGGKKVKTKVALFIAILMTGVAVFQVNDIAYNMSPVYLYSVESLGSIGTLRGEYVLDSTLPTTLYVVADIVLLCSIVVLVAWAMYKARKRWDGQWIE